MPTTVLVFAAHPDDAEFYAGGTLAEMIAEGARALLVIATDGRRGSYRHEGQTLADLRAEEARQAAAVLGAEPPILLGHRDLELDTLPPGRLRGQFVRLLREHRPDVVIAADAFAPYEIHPDHRAVALAASDALNFATLPLMHPEHLAEGLAPHFVPEKYFYPGGESEAGVNKIVDISAHMETKLAALAAHASQMEFLVEDVMRQAALAGIEPGQLLPGEAAGDPLGAVRWAMQARAAEVGRLAGFRYGEAFRYTRFHPFIEALLARPT